MKSVEHFILTPFGIGVSDHLWMLYRIELIKNIVIPSLKSQTNQNFRWCLLTDINAPKIIKSKLNELMSSMGNMEIHEVESWSDRIAFSRNINKLSNADYIVQTRIDDDDALNINAIEEIRNFAEHAIENNYDLGAIGVDGGFDYLCEEKMIAPNSANNLTIGLTVFHPSSCNVGLFDIKHDDILMYYSKIGFSTSIKFGSGGYLYTKHPLCDSNYFGMKWRVIRSQEKSIKQSDSIFWSNFGLSERNIDSLSAMFSDSPISFPSKAIALSTEKDNVSTAKDFLVSKNASKKMSKLLRYRIDREKACVLSIGQFAKTITERLFDAKYLSGAFFDYSFKEAVETKNQFDVIVIDEVEITNQISILGFEIVKNHLQYLEILSDYIFIVRWNTSQNNVEYNKKSHINTIVKHLYKVQDVGGWYINSSVPSELDRILTRTQNQLLANI